MPAREGRLAALLGRFVRRAPPDRRIGQQLVRAGLVTAEQVDSALARARAGGTRVGAALVELGFLAERDLVVALARQLRVPAVDLDRVDLDAATMALVPPDWAARHLAVALLRTQGSLIVAMADPADLDAVRELSRATGLEVEPMLAGEHQLRRIAAGPSPAPLLRQPVEPAP